MSSSCAWYKLFEIRRLIFHIGNPTVGHHGGLNDTVKFWMYPSHISCLVHSVQPLDNNFITCVNVHNYEHFEKGIERIFNNINCLCNTCKYSVQLVQARPTMHRIRLVIKWCNYDVCFKWCELMRSPSRTIAAFLNLPTIQFLIRSEGLRTRLSLYSVEKSFV